MAKKIKNFKNFLYRCWQVVNLPEPTPIQYDIADYLQYGGDVPNSDKNRIIQAFRGIGKTYITAAYVCFKLYHNCNEQVLIVSASKDFAIQIAKFIKDFIHTMPELQYLKPQKNTDADIKARDAITSFEVAGRTPAKDPSVKVVGISGQLTGSRATIIIADDIETSENCRSKEMQDKIDNAVTEFDNIVVPGGEVTYLGTPHTEQSLYNKLITRGYDLRIWTAKYVDYDTSERYKGHLAPFIAKEVHNQHLIGTSTEPLRFSNDDLDTREMKMGRSKFQMQFMLDPSLSDMERYPLRCSDLIVMDVDKDTAPEKVVYASSTEQLLEDTTCPGFQGDKYYKPMYLADTWLPYTNKIMFLDPAGKGSDECAYVILGLLNSQIFILDIGVVRGGYTQKNLMKLAIAARDCNVNCIYYESNFGDDMFLSLFQPYLRKIHLCGLEPIRNTKQKELRIIETLEPLMNQHRLIVGKHILEKDVELCGDYPPELKTVYQLFYQLTHISKDRGCLTHDDRLDALGGGCSILCENLSLDIDEEIKLREEELFKQAVNDWIDKFKVPLKGYEEPSWFNS